MGVGSPLDLKVSLFKWKQSFLLVPSLVPLRVRLCSTNLCLPSFATPTSTQLHLVVKAHPRPVDSSFVVHNKRRRRCRRRHRRHAQSSENKRDEDVFSCILDIIKPIINHGVARVVFGFLLIKMTCSVSTYPGGVSVQLGFGSPPLCCSSSSSLSVSQSQPDIPTSPFPSPPHRLGKSSFDEDDEAVRSISPQELLDRVVRDFTPIILLYLFIFFSCARQGLYAYFLGMDEMLAKLEPLEPGFDILMGRIYMLKERASYLLRYFSYGISGYSSGTMRDPEKHLKLISDGQLKKLDEIILANVEIKKVKSPTLTAILDIDENMSGFQVYWRLELLTLLIFFMDLMSVFEKLTSILRSSPPF